jgi:recombination protein RecT
MATSIRGAAASQEVAVREQREGVTSLRDSIKRSEAQFALALPQHVDAGRFLRCALTAINVVPKLSQCTQESVLGGLMQAAQLGLEVADVRGQAYLVPRWDGKDRCYKATFQLGYRGMIDLAARGGITVTVDDICEHDQYDFERGTNAYLRHKPTLANRGPIIAYYAVATFADGRPPAFVVLGRGEAEAHRDRFASTRSKEGEIYGTWVEHFDAMARKTAVRKLLNYLPATVELRQAAAIEVTATEDIGPISYGSPTVGALDAALPAADVDPTTGEIVDATTAGHTPNNDDPQTEADGRG